ncbi:GAF domain-containing protein [Rhodoferax sp. GW822-FHT02A01]|uniref:GAF domain-containing protein n=1 Tax=Rhodoferax sp. GW822-FHT02A01 TaxID=3141537 RepID=UPI00315DF21E
MNVRIDHIREAMEGVIPGVMATCSAEGEPNVAFLSQVQYVDRSHIALSYQFFNKTRRNILANPYGQLTIVHPRTAQIYRLRLHYLRTESSGPLFERMKAHLEGIASHTGMSGVFRLLGSDIYEVLNVEALPGNTLPAPVPDRNHLSALRRCSERIAECASLSALVDTTLDVLEQEMGIEHAIFLMLDESGTRLYTVGSRGYSTSGVGSEVALGDGVIGVCAEAKSAIRVSWVTQAYRYSKAIRDVVLQDGIGRTLSTEIPYPGLADPHSQLGLPLMQAGKVCGVLFVESNVDLRFSYDDEDTLAALAAQVAASMRALQEGGDGSIDAETPAPQDSVVAAPPPAQSLRVRCFRESRSIFFDDTYIIKGVAGAILWHLLQEYVRDGRTEFSNREIRLNPDLGLPDVVDNLEARLVLLRRRLADQAMGIAIEKCGRGRLRLSVQGSVELKQVD